MTRRGAHSRRNLQLAQELGQGDAAPEQVSGGANASPEPVWRVTPVLVHASALVGLAASGICPAALRAGHACGWRAGDDRGHRDHRPSHRRARDHPLPPAVRQGQRLRPGEGRPVDQGAVCHRHLLRCAHRAARHHRLRARGREPDRVGRVLRGPARHRQAQARAAGPPQAAVTLYGGQGPCRYRAPARVLSPPGASCHHRRVQDRRPGRGPRRCRLRHQGGRGHQDRQHLLHRQPGVLAEPAARRHLHQPIRLARHLQERGVLRSRAHRPRQGAAAPPLPQERLPRRPRARGGGRQERRGHRLRHHLHGRGRRALRLRRRHHQLQAARRRHGGAAIRASPSSPAAPTTWRPSTSRWRR